MKTIHFLSLSLIAFFMAGCSTVSTFHQEPEKNLHVAVKLKDPDSKIRADLDIYAEVDKCNDKYIGSVELNKPVVDIGLPVGKKLHLTYVITRNESLGSDSIYLQRPKEGPLCESHKGGRADLWGICAAQSNRCS